MSDPTTTPSTNIAVADFFRVLTCLSAATSPLKRDQPPGVLHGIQITATAKGLVLVASTSHILAEWTIPAAEGANAKTLLWPLPLGVPLVVLVDPKVTKAWQTQTGVKATLAATDLILDSGFLTLVMPRIEGQFPPYQRIIETPLAPWTSFSGDAHIGIAVTELNALTKALAIPKDSAITLQFTGTHGHRIVRPLFTCHLQRIGAMGSINIGA
jgi:hypothetical protein